jgi:hypothetical protein
MGVWKNLAKVVTYPVTHPQRAVREGFGIAKKGAIAGTVGYLGWKKLTTDKSLARIAGEAVVGKSVVDGAVSIGSDLNGLREEAGGALEKVNDTLTGVNGGLNGVNKFFQGLFSGNGGNMLGNFFSNLGSGNVSGLGIAGLVGAALLIFGRFGWFGKIAGALLGMLVIGNNFNLKSSTGGQTTRKDTQKLPYSNASAYSPKDDQHRVFVKAWSSDGKDCPAVEMPRQQYDALIREGYTNAQIYQEVSQMQKEKEEEKRRAVIVR